MSISSASISGSSSYLGSGGAFYLSGLSQVIAISSSTFNSISSYQLGGVFYSDSITTNFALTIASSTFNTFTAST